MDGLKEIAANAAQQWIDSGEMKTRVEATVVKTLNEIVGNALQSYSDFGKQMKAAVESALAINVQDLKLAGYNQVVLAIVQQKLDAAIEIQGNQKIAREMAKLLGENAPKTIALSEVIKKFKKSIARENCGCGEVECTILVSRSEYRSRHIALDERPKTLEYACKYRLLVGDDGEMFSASLGGIDPKKQLFLGGMYGFDKILFQLYAAGSKIQFDRESFDTRVPREGDEDYPSESESLDEIKV